MSVLVLDASTKYITAVMSGAAATTNPDYTCHYADVTNASFLEAESDGTLNGATPVTIVSAPTGSTRRVVREITIMNRDTAAVTVTVNLVSSGGTRQIYKGSIGVGYTWRLSDSFGDAVSASSDTVAGIVELATTAETLTGTDATRAVTPDGLYSGVTHRICGLVSNPQAVYTQRAQIVMFRAPAALTITRIHIHGSDTTPTSELAGDLKFADDINTGGFANATIIDVCDTTSGVVTITTGFDDATVPSGKYIYFQMDSSPHADWKDFYIEFYYTLD